MILLQLLLLEFFNSNLCIRSFIFHLPACLKKANSNLFSQRFWGPWLGFIFHRGFSHFWLYRDAPCSHEAHFDLCRERYLLFLFFCFLWYKDFFCHWEWNSTLNFIFHFLFRCCHHLHSSCSEESHSDSASQINS